jgi:hypothetical protein
VSRNPKKVGGLNFNPLLGRTEGAEQIDVAIGEEPSPAPEEGMTSHAHETPGEGAPVKFTFYFTPEQLDRLDLAWSRFRRQSRGADRRLSKSLFIRVALDRLLDEFDRQPEEVMALLRGQGAESVRTPRQR